MKKLKGKVVYSKVYSEDSFGSPDKDKLTVIGMLDADHPYMVEMVVTKVYKMDETLMREVDL